MSKPTTPTVPAVPATMVVAGKVRETPVIATIRTDIAIPQRSSARGSKSAYNFDILTAVGNSFGVKNKTSKQLGPIVNRENRKNCTETPDPLNPGKAVKTYSKRFEVFDVDPKTDPDGAKVRVFRVE